MKKAELYVEGARLPEQLSRLIFLEGMIAGRRVLEVGARSPAVARFLLEQGAARVVCAIDDRDLLERLRDENDLDRVDYRAVRPAGGSRPPGLAQVPVLPGDDGAFDLVIDFTLPEALAAGVTERLTDIKRLLSPEGFAVTALSSTPRGLGMLLDASGPQPVRLGYRPLVDALRGTFELAQVYFQSLMLGYLFGSFDIEGGDDGIAPQTTLMDDGAEPAGAYVFAFGNAIPVIEDVCLVQVPFDALLDAVIARRPATASTLPMSAEAFGDRTELGGNASRGVDRDDRSDDDDDDDDDDSDAFAVELQARDLRIALLEQQLLEAEAGNDSDSDDDSDDDSADLSELVTGLARRLDEAVTRALTSEQQIAVREVELVRALAIRDELRFERDALAEQLVAVDGERGGLHRRARDLEEELLHLNLRLVELEDSAIGSDVQRSALQIELLELQTLREHERLRQHAEREMLEAALAENTAVVVDLQAALTEAGVVLAERIAIDDRQIDSANHDDETSTVAARVRASLQERFAAIEQRAERAELLAEALRAQLDIAERDLDDARLAIDERAAAVEAAAADEAERARVDTDELQEALQLAATALDDAQQALLRRTDDAARLAAAVQRLVAERATIARQLDEARAAAVAVTTQAEHDVANAIARANSSTAEATELRLALDEVRAAFDTAQLGAQQEREQLAEQQTALQTQLEQRRGHDQRQLEEARRQLDDSRGGLQDLTAQRDVLQQALTARERELAAVVVDVDTARTTIEQLEAQVAARAQKHADVEGAAEALSLEVRRLNAVVEDNGSRLLTLQQEREALTTRAAAAEAARIAAEDETLKMMVLVEDLEKSGAAARDQWRAEQDARHAAALAAVDAALQTTQQALRDAEGALTRALDAARIAADDSAAARADAEKQRREHEETRDELAQLTTSLLELEETVQQQRGEAERRHAETLQEAVDRAVIDARDSARQAAAVQETALRDEQQVMQVLLDEVLGSNQRLEQQLAQTKLALDTDGGALIALRAEHTTLQEVHTALLDEHQQLGAVRTVVEATLAEATEQLVERQAQLEVLEARHAALGLEHNERSEQAATLAATLAALRDEHVTTTAALTTRASAHEDALSTVSTLTMSATALQLANDAQALALRDAENAWLRAEGEATAAVAALTTVKAELATAISERDAAVAERDEVKQQLAAALKRTDVLQQRLDATTLQLQEVDDEAQLAAERAHQRASEQDKAIADGRAALEDATIAHLAALEALRSNHADDGESQAMQLAELQAALAARQVREGELEALLASARADADVATATTASVGTSLEAALEREAALQEQLTEIRAAVDAATTDVEAARALEASLRAQLHASTVDADERTARLIASHDVALDTAQVAARTALVAAQEYADEFARQLAEENEGIVATLRAELRAAIERQAALQQAIETAQQQARDDVEQREAHHRLALDELQGVLHATTTRADDLQRELEAAQQALSTMRDEGAATRTQHDDAIAALKLERDATVNTLESERDEFLSLAKAENDDAIAALTARHVDAVDALKRERHEAIAAIGASHEQSAAAARAEHDALSARARELESALDDAIQQYTVEAEAKEALEGEAASSRTRLDELQRRLDEQLAELRTVAAAKDAAVAARATTDDALDSARARAAELQDRFDAAAREHADVDAARLAVVAALSAVEVEQQALRARLGALEALEAAVVTANEEREALQQLVDEQRVVQERERSRGDLFSAQFEEAATTLAHERARGDLLQATLDEARAVADATRCRPGRLAPRTRRRTR